MHGVDDNSKAGLIKPKVSWKHLRPSSAFGMEACFGGHLTTTGSAAKPHREADGAQVCYPLPDVRPPRQMRRRQYRRSLRSRPTAPMHFVSKDYQQISFTCIAPQRLHEKHTATCNKLRHHLSESESSCRRWPTCAATSQRSWNICRAVPPTSVLQQRRQDAPRPNHNASDRYLCIQPVLVSTEILISKRYE